jgi:outer membrane murein-binding lipoprotein Lpp
VDTSDIIAVVAVAVAVIASVPGFFAIHQSKKANRISASARDLAAESNRISEEANRISEQALSQASERNVVDFGWVWNEDGTATVTNRGEGTAYDVDGYLELNGERVTIAATEIGPSCDLTLKFPQTFQGLQEDERAYERELAEERKRQRNSPLPLPGSLVMPRLPKQDKTVFRVSWTSPRGVPATFGPVENSEATLTLNQ